VIAKRPVRLRHVINGPPLPQPNWGTARVAQKPKLPRALATDLAEVIQHLGRADDVLAGNSMGLQARDEMLALETTPNWVHRLVGGRYRPRHLWPQQAGIYRRGCAALIMATLTPPL